MKMNVITQYFSFEVVDGLTKIIDMNEHFTILNKDELRDLYKAIGSIINEQDEKGE